MDYSHSHLSSDEFSEAGTMSSRHARFIAESDYNHHLSHHGPGSDEYSSDEASLYNHPSAYRDHSMHDLDSHRSAYEFSDGGDSFHEHRGLSAMAHSELGSDHMDPFSSEPGLGYRHRSPSLGMFGSENGHFTSAWDNRQEGMSEATLSASAYQPDGLHVTSMADHHVWSDPITHENSIAGDSLAGSFFDSHRGTPHLGDMDLHHGIGDCHLMEMEANRRDFLDGRRGAIRSDLATSGQEMDHLTELMADSSIDRLAGPRGAVSELGLSLMPHQHPDRYLHHEAAMMGGERQRAMDHAESHFGYAEPPHGTRHLDDLHLREELDRQNLDHELMLQREHDFHLREELDRQNLDHELMLQREHDFHLRDEIDRQNLDHELMLHHENDMERAMALEGELGLDRDYRFERGVGLPRDLGLMSGYGVEHGYGPHCHDDLYRGAGVMHGYGAHYHDDLFHGAVSPHYGWHGMIDDPYYSHMASVLPRELPMFSDPYAMGMRSGGGYRHGYQHGLGLDPFMHGINHDYGWGPIRPLSSYGLSRDALQPGYGQMLDDLYLFEMMLRLDRTLDEHERSRRWRERLDWEMLSELERQKMWRNMDMLQRSRLGIGTGSYWGHRFGRLPINPSFGYANPVWGMGYGMCSRQGPVIGGTHPMGFPGRYPLGTGGIVAGLGAASLMDMVGQPHYSLPPFLMSRYPMWNDGGLGLGRRISPWLGSNPLMRLTPKDLIRRENMRLDYAERRGEIPPRPLIRGPGLVGTGVPEQFIHGVGRPLVY